MAWNTGGLPTVQPTPCQSPQTVQFVVEAWRGRADLEPATAVRLAASAPLAFTFDDRGFARGLQLVDFAAQDVPGEPGHVQITAVPNNATMYRNEARLVSWSGFQPAGTVDAASGLPAFALDMGLLASGMRQYSTRYSSAPAINVSFSQPGVYYVGVYGVWNGEYGFTDPKPNAGVRTYYSFPLDTATGRAFQPMAIVIPYENGTVPAVPPGFAGPRHVTPPIPGDRRLALVRTHLTVFHGATIMLPLTQPGASGAAFGPAIIELDLPPHLTLVPTWSPSNNGVGAYNVTGSHKMMMMMMMTMMMKKMKKEKKKKKKKK